MMKEKGKQGKIIWAAVLAAVLGVSFLFSGCDKKVAVTAEKRTEKGYAYPEIMVIAMAEKNAYEEICTEQIWGTTVPNEEEKFDEYLKEQIRTFMDEMKLMNLLAAERGISLTTGEKNEMGKAAEEYYKSLTPDDIAYMELSREDAIRVYEDYRLANKLVEELTKDVNLEVSDSEAKVITFMQASSESQEAAALLSQAASAENADFQECAQAAGLSVTTRQLGRAEEDPKFEDAAFSLSTGQVSGVIEDNGTYYVLKCLSDYDEEATNARKEMIFQERRKKAFREIYDGFQAGVQLTYAEEDWKRLQLDGGACAKSADFFGLYEKYAGEQRKGW